MKRVVAIMAVVFLIGVAPAVAHPGLPKPAETEHIDGASAPPWCGVSGSIYYYAHSTLHKATRYLLFYSSALYHVYHRVQTPYSTGWLFVGNVSCQRVL